VTAARLALVEPVEVRPEHVDRAPTCREQVQDRIRRQGPLVWQLLSEGGYVYVCGVQPMREGVRVAFVEVLADHGAMSPESAEAFMADLESAGRYRPDLWA